MLGKQKLLRLHAKFTISSLPPVCPIKKVQTFPKPAYSKESKFVTGFDTATKNEGRQPINTQLVSVRKLDSMKYRCLWLTCSISNPLTIISMLQPGSGFCANAASTK